jgi:hypothetical protein
MTESHVSFPLLRSYHRASPGPSNQYLLSNKVCFFSVRSSKQLVQPHWKTNSCRLSATAYSIHSQLPSILVAVPSSATWGRAMPWWQGFISIYTIMPLTEWTSVWSSELHQLLRKPVTFLSSFHRYETVLCEIHAKAHKTAWLRTHNTIQLN